MSSIDHVSQRADAQPGLVLQPHRPHHLAVHQCDLFAVAQVCNGRGTMLLRDAEGDAAARATAVEAEHKARLFRRSTMHEGVDAKRAMLADKPRRDLLDVFETR